MRENEYIWTINKIVEDTPTTKTLHLSCNEVRPEFVAGQYLTVRLPEVPSVVEGKSYSISSAPYEEEVTLTVKKIGVFSSAILSKKEGDTILTGEPYGFFYPDEADEVLVFIAAGIGVTPYLSIIKQLIYEGDNRPIVLITSNRTVSEAVFTKQFEGVSNVSVCSYITRDEAPPAPHIKGRMTPTALLSMISNPTRATFFLCGSMHFTKEMWHGLKEAGVAQEQIYTEGFF